jgi:hypothetical protein
MLEMTQDSIGDDTDTFGNDTGSYFEITQYLLRQRKLWRWHRI